jgi:hypothetical protein
VSFVNQKVFTIFLLAACCLAVSTSLWGQDTAASPGIPGYLNPRTGVFRSIQHQRLRDAAEPPPTATFTGTIVVNFTITVSSAIPATQQIACVAGATLRDTATENAILDIASSVVTRGTGSTLTCSVTIPYSWTLGSASTDSVGLSYSVTSPVNFTTPAGEWPHYSGAQSLGTISVPVSGTTTTENVTTRI